MKKLLRFITCGNVDDGKSTLIGHLLYESKLLFADQEKALELDSKVGSRGGEIDYALLLDGLLAEREQGITIDVAYRYFTTDERSFIVADTPGHEEYTRNMAVGASFAELAILLVDATKGITVQTKRHARICALMGIRHIVVAVNKMDLVNFEQQRFEAIKRDFLTLATTLDFSTIQVIPVSATNGDNIITASAATPWYEELALLPYLEAINVEEDELATFTLPIQRVSRPNQDFRGFQGQIESGRIAVGDEIIALPSNERAIVKQILVTDRTEQEAVAGQPVTVQLSKEVDVSRGCVLTTDTTLTTAQKFTAHVLVLDTEPLVIGKNYLCKIGTQTIAGVITAITHKINIENDDLVAAESLQKNELAECTIALAEPVIMSTFNTHHTLGSFILIDRLTHMTAACGVIQNLEQTTSIFAQQTTVTAAIREAQKQQRALTLWFTGLSGAGKSTLANEVEKRLVLLGHHTMLLDGDNLRLGLNKNLAFDEASRSENNRRIAEVAKLLNEAGLITLAACISPLEQDRKQAQNIIGEAYIEIFISTPLTTCESRDTKGLYAKARQQEIEAFTGISSPYETPKKPHIIVDTTSLSIEQATDKIMRALASYL